MDICFRAPDNAGMAYYQHIAAYNNTLPGSIWMDRDDSREIKLISGYELVSINACLGEIVEALFQDEIGYYVVNGFSSIHINPGFIKVRYADGSTEEFYGAKLIRAVSL